MRGHGHDHAHEREHSAGSQRDARPLRLALVIVGLFLVVEVVGALLTDSLALLADAGHMLSDVAALALSLFAVWIARRPTSHERTYGYHRVEVLAAAVNAVTLVAISLYIFWEAYQRLGQPPEVASGPMIAVAFVGLLSNVAAARVLQGGAEESINMRAALLHVLSDLLGSIGAIVAGLVMFFTGWYYADPLVSVAIGLLVLVSGLRLLRETVDILLEATPGHIDLMGVERELRALPGVVGVHDLHVWTVTSGFLAMSGHLRVDETEDGRVLGEASALLRERFGIGHSTIQIERAGDLSELRGACGENPDDCGCVGSATSSRGPHVHNH